MTELKVGDVVTVTGWEIDSLNPTWEGRTGMVYIADDQAAVCVEFKDGKQYSRGGWNAKFLKKVEPAFTFKDIQVGDKIRRTLTRKSGTIEVREGVVAKMDYRFVLDKGGAVLAYASDAQPFAAEVVLELLDRPKPKEPELWENRKPGDQIATYDLEGKFERVFTKREDGRWDSLVINTAGKLQRGFERSDEDIALHARHHAKSLQLVSSPS